MKININKKMFLYEVDPLFFYDSNNDGFGDFKGFAKKLDYFDFLNIDAFVFPDIYNQEDVILKNIQLTTFDKCGSINDLKDLITKIKSNNKDLFVSINLEKILNSLIIKTSIEEMKSIDITKFINEENNFQNGLKWNTQKRIEAFIKIIKFWRRNGVSNFVFTNFEFLYEKNIKLDNQLLEQLKFLYNQTKELCPDSIIALRSLFFQNKVINEIFNKYIGQICDIYIDSSYSLISTEKNYEFDIIKEFNHKLVLKKIKQIKIKSNYYSRYCISFNNNRVGRINSRWLNEENLIDESNKSLLMLLNMNPYSSITYYGDEIGLLRLKIENSSDFQDYEYVEKKRKLEFNKFKVKDFEYSQKYLSRINSQSIFVWNSTENGGFSKAKKIFRKLPINWKTHNLKDEYLNGDSIVNFYKKIIELTKNYVQSSQLDKIKIRLSKKIFLIKVGSGLEQKMIIVNLSNKSFNKRVSSKWNVILSTLIYKQYNSGIKMICPYESLVLQKGVPINNEEK